MLFITLKSHNSNIATFFHVLCAVNVERGENGDNTSTQKERDINSYAYILCYLWGWIFHDSNIF